MTQVTVGENEGIESALRRFKRQVSKAGIFADLKRLRHHETPIEKYKRKAQQRRRRRLDRSAFLALSPLPCRNIEASVF
jgi:small subunit ribosomal protein S21